ncbi:hypothetical protein Agabi119p4_7643 [Agaricus bisporus var. burnettii]|uniref:DNA 3'-5' helicase n=1 Tax=Agaricus bisporus var. burnettii TaxID=192524 RepID=A0A8H7C8M2_AGABI|nr:hypothetical protein Agabi119p4_7643 [Agaricus bisporus var. burnettii]
MKRAADEQPALTADKRPRAGPDHQVPQRECIVCRKSLANPTKNFHPACVKQDGFFSNPKTNEAFNLQRDPNDNMVSCPRCNIKEFNMDEIKKHLRKCDVLQGGSRSSEDTSIVPANPPEHLSPSEIDRLVDIQADTVLHSLPQILSSGHIDNTQQSHSPELSDVNLEESPIPVSPIIQTPLLKELGLVVNTLHSIVICLACKGIINPFDIRHHFFEHHKTFKTRLTLQHEFQSQVIDRYPSLTDEPIHPCQAVDPIYGLADPVGGYTECSTCHHCYASGRSFKAHSCADPKPLASPTYVQQFRNFSGCPLFPVKFKAEAPLYHSLWHRYKQQSAAQETQPESSAHQENHRVLHQFLRREGFLQKVDGIKHELLIPLASYSSSDTTYGTLHKATTSFLSNAQLHTQSYYTRRLISTRPAEEHDETRVRHHRSVNYETLQTYGRIIAGLVAFIHRFIDGSGTGYECLIPSGLADACRALVSSLDPPATHEENLEGEVIHGIHTYDSDDDSDIDEEDSIAHARDPDVPKPSQSTQKYLMDILYLLYTQIPCAETRGQFFSPITHYILISSLRKDQQWAQAGMITHTIAALLFTGRLVFASVINETLQRTGCNATEAFEPIEKYFNERTESILPTLYLLKRGLASLHTAAESSFHFNAPDLSGKSAIFEGKELSLDDIGELHRQFIAEITQTVNDLTFHHPDFALAETELIHDEPRETKAGYSFVTDQRNSWNHRPSLLQHILQTPSLFQKYAYIMPDGLISWISTSIADYVQEVYDVQMKIVCTVILSYGEPARGTELASHLLSNVPGGSIRNFFVLFNMPVLRASFNKTSSPDGSDKVICRFPLPELKSVFIRFLAYIRPLYAQWQAFLRPHMASNATYYLFVGLFRPLTSPDISSILAKYTQERLGVRLTLRSHRQYMAFITTCNHSVFAHATESDAETYKQFGHSETMNTQHYGQDSRTPAGMNLKSFFANARVSGVFHLLYGHPPTLLRHLEDGKSHSRRLIAIIDSIHGTSVKHTATENTQLNIACDNDLLIRIRQLFNQSIAASHAAITQLFVPSTTTQHSENKSSSPSIKVHPFVVRKLREVLLHLPPNTSFSNQQQGEVAQLLLEGHRHIVYISPTGSGKTTPPLLAAKSFDQGRSTIFLLPLLAMHVQYKHAALNFELNVESWSPKTSSLAPPTLILATIDIAAYKIFKTYIHILVQKNLLARIVIDEAHLILTHADFRPVMSLLQWLASTPVPILLMTATLPPSLERALVQKIGITSAYVTRAPTPRCNISFRVVYADGQMEDAVKREFQRAMAYSNSNRALIFCLSVSEAIFYGRLLGIPSCYSRLGFDDLKSILERFRCEPNTRALATTSILGVGLDIPDVTHTIHVNFPRDTVSYIQEAGRAGRGHGFPPAFSTVVLPHTVELPRFFSEDSFGKQVLYTSLTDNSKCRRTALHLFLDGQESACSMLSGSAHFCDVCEVQSIAPPGTSAIATPYNMTEHFD